MSSCRLDHEGRQASSPHLLHSPWSGWSGCLGLAWLGLAPSQNKPARPAPGHKAIKIQVFTNSSFGENSRVITLNQNPTTLSKHSGWYNAETLWHKNIGPAFLEMQEHPGPPNWKHMKTEEQPGLKRRNHTSLQCTPAKTGLAFCHRATVLIIRKPHKNLNSNIHKPIQHPDCAKRLIN